MYNDFETETRRKTLQTRRRHRILGLVACLAAVIIAFVVGYLVRRSTHQHCSHTFIKHIKKDPTKKDSTGELEKLYDEVAQMVSREKLKENLRYFAKKSHMASLPRNNELAQTIKERFESYGFETSTPSYHVLLSLPPLDGRKNQATLLAKNGTTIYQTNYTQGVHPFMAYSPNGTVEGGLVFANYARESDFEELKIQGVNCTGKVVIVRFGKSSWFGKVKTAYKHGAVGVLLYSDPSRDIALDDVFPQSEHLPHDGIKRGALLPYDGDPLTLGYPAKEWVFREKVEDVNLVKIPCQPISVEDAFMIMREMDGLNVTAEDWKGGLNITYRFSDSKKIRLEVYNKLEIRKITNVIGNIAGSVEPDRWVMMGNHRDAWVNGAVDASSGTSVMMEMARCLAQKLKTGWRPRRTIKFLSWDGEEFGLHGSYEFVEEHKHLLRERGVVYLNVDMAVATNHSLKLRGSPIYKNLAFSASKRVKYFNEENTTVYDKMVELDMNKNYTRVGIGSDYAAFNMVGSVPAIDMGYVDHFNYSTYHTQYDRIDYMENYVDPGYWAHESVAKVGLHIILSAASRPIIQYTCTQIAETLEEGFLHIKFSDEVESLGNTNQGKRALALLGRLYEAIRNFRNSTEQLDAAIKSTNNTSELKTRVLNDIGKGLERTFYKDEGLESDRHRKNYIFSISDKAYGVCFPTVLEAIKELKVAKTPTSDIQTKLERELTAVTLIVEESTNFINDGMQHLNHIKVLLI